MPAPRARKIVKKRSCSHTGTCYMAECELIVLTRCGLKSRMSDEEQLTQTKAGMSTETKTKKE